MSEFIFHFDKVGGHKLMKGPSSPICCRVSYFQLVNQISSITSNIICGRNHGQLRGKRERKWQSQSHWEDSTELVGGLLSKRFMILSMRLTVEQHSNNLVIHATWLFPRCVYLATCFFTLYKHSNINSYHWLGLQPHHLLVLVEVSSFDFFWRNFKMELHKSCRQNLWKMPRPQRI